MAGCSFTGPTGLATASPFSFSSLGDLFGVFFFPTLIGVILVIVIVVVYHWKKGKGREDV